MKWISVKERLPEELQRVLVFDKELGTDSIEVARHRNSGQFDSDYFGYIQPSHWMMLKDIPLPKD